MVVFFFQAGDGIRDAQESRGLGVVCKRQVVEEAPLVVCSGVWCVGDPVLSAAAVVEGTLRAAAGPLVEPVVDDMVDFNLPCCKFNSANLRGGVVTPCRHEGWFRSTSCALRVMSRTLMMYLLALLAVVISSLRKSSRALVPCFVPNA